MIKEFKVSDRVKLTISYESLDDLYRVRMSKVDRLVDFDNRCSIKFIKERGRIKLFSLSEEVKNKSYLIDKLKSNVKFMNEVKSIIDLIQSFMKPSSLDVSEILGDGFIINEDPLIPDDIRIVWYNEDRELSNKLTIISIF